jgi:hypothetical protein
MLSDSWAGRNPTRVVVPIEEEGVLKKKGRHEMGMQDGIISYVQLMSITLIIYFSFLTSRKPEGLKRNYFIPIFS